MERRHVMPVLCLFIVFIAFLSIFTDGTVLLMKKISTGKFDAHFSEMDSDMREGAFLLCVGIGSTIFPLLFTSVAVIGLGHRISVLLAIFVLFAHALYRTLVVLLDIAARKYPVADDDISRRRGG